MRLGESGDNSNTAANCDRYLCLPTRQAVRKDWRESKLAFRESESVWFRNFLRGHFEYLLWVYKEQRGS